MTERSMTQALRDTLAAEMARDERVFLIGEDIGTYGGAFGVTRELLAEFGEARVRDTPISEAAIIGTAIGAAIAGSRPVAEIMFMDFITLALDQLINQAAKLRYIFGDQFACPLVVRTPIGGGRGYGATHSQCLERLLFGIPGLQIVAPSDAVEAAGLLTTAIRNDNPVLFLEHKLLYPQRMPFPDEGALDPTPFGRARTLAGGDDVTLVAWSYMSHLARQAVEQLAAVGISAELIDLRTLAPLDMDAVCASVAHTGRLAIIEEGPVTGGIGAEIGCRAAERVYDCLEAPVCRIAMPDCPIPAAIALERAILPTVERIVAAVTALMETE